MLSTSHTQSNFPHSKVAFNLMGLSFVWYVTFIIAYTFIFMPPTALSMIQINVSRVLYLLFIATAQGLLMEIANRFWSRTWRRTLAITATALIAIICISYYPACTLGGGWVYAILLSLAGIWQGVFHVLWPECLMGLEPTHQNRIIYGSVCIGAALFLLSLFVVDSLVPILVLSASCLSLILYFFGWEKYHPYDFSINRLSRKLTKGLRKSDAVLLTYGGVFGVSIYGCIDPTIRAHIQNYLPIGICICAAGFILLAINLVSNKDYTLKDVVISLSSIVAIIMIIQIYCSNSVAWDLYPLMLGFLTVFDCVAFCFQLKIVRELNLSPFICIARGRFFVQLGMFVGALCYWAFLNFTIDGYGHGMIVPLILLAALFILMSSCSNADFIPKDLVDSPPPEYVIGSNENQEEQSKDSQILSSISEDYDLSNRERDVLSLIFTGYTLALIADELDISINTVKTHCYHMYRKMGVYSKTEVLAIRNQYTKELSSKDSENNEMD